LRNMKGRETGKGSAKAENHCIFQADGGKWPNGKGEGGKTMKRLRDEDISKNRVGKKKGDRRGKKSTPPTENRQLT